MLAHATAVAPYGDDMAVVQQAVYQDRRHNIVTEHLTSLLEALVGGEEGGGCLVPAGHQLEEEHRPGLLMPRCRAMARLDMPCLR